MIDSLVQDSPAPEQEPPGPGDAARDLVAAIPQQRGNAAHPTKIVLRALSAALCDQHVPYSLDSSEDRQRIQDIQDHQLNAAWRQLRSRYPTIAIAAMQLYSATVRATWWADDILEQCDPERKAYEPARLALVATLARRLIVDDLAIARNAVEHCRETVSGLVGTGRTVRTHT